MQFFQNSVHACTSMSKECPLEFNVLLLYRSIILPIL